MKEIWQASADPGNWPNVMRGGGLRELAGLTFRLIARVDWQRTPSLSLLHRTFSTFRWVQNCRGGLGHRADRRNRSHAAVARSRYGAIARIPLGGILDCIPIRICRR